MALLRIRKAPLSLCKSILTVRPIALSIPCSEIHLCPSYLQRLISSGAQGGIFLTPDQISVSNALISILAKQPFSPDNPELKRLGPKLTNKIVESVLNGLNSWKAAHLFFTWAAEQHGYKHNVYTYNAMASILSGARQNAPLKVLVRDIINSRCSMSPGSLGFLLRCLGSLGLGDEANEIFDQVKKMGLCVTNSYSYNCLLEAVAKSGLVDLVEVRLKEMHDFGWQFDRYTLTPVLIAYCNAGKFKKALSVFNEVLNRGWVDEHVFSILVVSCCKWGEVDMAIGLIDRMERHNLKLNEKTFSVLIHGFVKESRVDKALYLFDKMLQSGFHPAVSHFDVMIGELCKSNELEKAFSLLSKMKELGICPDVTILMKLTSYLPEGEFRRLFDECLGDKKLEVKIFLYNSVLKGLVSNGSIDKAYQLFQQMMGNDWNGVNMLGGLAGEQDRIAPNTASFSIVINGLLKAKKVDLALKHFRDMAIVGYKPPLLLYNNLIDELCKLNRLEESSELLREMKEVGLEPTQFTHNCIFGCLCSRADVQGALDLVRKMRFQGHEPWTKHSTLLVKELCKDGKALDACKFLADILEEGFPPDIISYSAAIGGLVKMGELDRAVELFQDICTRGYCPDVIAYNILIKALCKAHRVLEAEDLLNEMMLKGLLPSVVTYNSLIDGWCKNGKIDKAMLCLSRMFREDRNPNVITYSTLIDGLCTVGRSGDALNLWNEMKRNGCAANRIAFMALINGLCKCGRSSEALLHFHEMKEKGMEPDSYVYVALISAFLSDNNLPLTFDILKEMVEVGKFPDQPDKILVIKTAIGKLSEDDRTSHGVKNLIGEGGIQLLMSQKNLKEEIKPLLDLES
ncbi:hypothetical protein SLA2020_056960 [Shorea laevis]